MGDVFLYLFKFIQLLHNVQQLFIEIFVENSSFKSEVRHWIYLARHDSAEDCAEAAETLWHLLRFDTSPDVWVFSSILKCFQHFLRIYFLGFSKYLHKLAQRLTNFCPGG